MRFGSLKERKRRPATWGRLLFAMMLVMAMGAVAETLGTPVSISVFPSSTSLSLGSTEALVAIATYSDGSTEDITPKVLFTSSDPSVLVVDADGMAEAVGMGQVQVIATPYDPASGNEGIASITVTAAAPFGGSTTTSPDALSITVLEDLFVYTRADTLAIGQTVQFTVVGYFSDGSKQDLTSTAAWSSDDPTVASVTPGTGSVTANRIGSTAVWASVIAQTPDGPLSFTASGAISVSP